MDGEANVKLDARYCHLFESRLSNGLSDTLTGGVRGRASAGKDWYGFMVGLDMRFGAGLQGGFAYEFALLPLGAAVLIDEAGSLGLLFGAGIDGVTARVPFAVTSPAELVLELDIDDSVRLAGWFSPRWILAADARQGGQGSLALGDEFRIGSAASAEAITTLCGHYQIIGKAKEGIGANIKHAVGEGGGRLVVGNQGCVGGSVICCRQRRKKFRARIHRSYAGKGAAHPVREPDQSFGDERGNAGEGIVRQYVVQISDPTEGIVPATWGRQRRAAVGTSDQHDPLHRDPTLGDVELLELFE